MEGPHIDLKKISKGKFSLSICNEYIGVFNGGEIRYFIEKMDTVIDQGK